MKYAAVIAYTSDKDLIATHRPPHREYLTSLKVAGKLVAAGPFTDDSGALIVYEAEDEAAARKMVEDDPFHKNGIFQEVDLRPWKVVFANRELLSE